MTKVNHQAKPDIRPRCGEQLDKTLAEQRTRTLNERFAAAAGQLGSDKPPEVRLAGVYAMAAWRMTGREPADLR